MIILIITTINYIYKYENTQIRNYLCSSLIDNVEYDFDQELCRLPCYAENNYTIIVKSDNESCPLVKPSILIQNNTIYALINTEISQYIRNIKKYRIRTKSLHKGESIALKSEVVRTKSNYTGKDYDWYIKFIPQHIDNNIKSEKLSVNLLLIDAVSRYVAKKQLQETVKTLKSISSHYSTYEMLRYHTLAANSNPHYPTLFYGVNETEGQNINKIIFEDFKEEGYKTINTVLFVDPYEKLTANNNYNGSDHYVNFLCEDPRYNNVGGEGQYGHHARCVGHKEIHKYAFEYLKESIKYYHSKKQPTFSVSVFLEAHDYLLLSLPRIDKDLSDYIKFLHKERILNDSMLIIFSDHGIHYGPYKATNFGTLDHSLPLMFMVFPKWFSKKYPEINMNMKINQNRFVTGYDLHSTLFDIAHFGSNLSNIQNKRGTSLFNKIPKTRNCHEFHVVFGCSCNMTQEYLNIP